jgi:hypothetical protein
VRPRLECAPAVRAKASRAIGNKDFRISVDANRSIRSTIDGAQKEKGRAS